MKWTRHELAGVAVLLHALITGANAAPEVAVKTAPTTKSFEIQRDATALSRAIKSLPQNKVGADSSMTKQQKNAASIAVETAPTTEPYMETWLAAKINGVADQNSTLLVRDRSNHLFAPAGAFGCWRIKAPAADPIIVDGARYLPLDGIDGLGYTVDEATQELLIEGRPQLFSSTVIDNEAPGFSRPAARSIGGFFNYDLQYINQDSENSLDGLFELGLFNRFGVGASSFLGRGLDNGADIIRLDSTWTHDWPEHLRSLRLGDAISRPGAWGRAVRFGGVQWGTNFATQPQSIPFPLPTFAGEAALPSTVDVFSDNAKQLSQNVPSGPFTIPNPPVVTGAGEVTLVVRDLLGREQVITQPYYVSQTLLRKGLHDYSYELGFVRENFGIKNNDYGRFFAAGTHRLGVTDQFTGELHAEALEDQQTAGVGGSFLWPSIGTANLAIAASQHESNAGALISFGFDRQGRRVSYGFQSELTTANFTQLGLQPGEAAPRRTTIAHLGFPVTGRDSLSLSYLNQDYREQTDTNFFTLSYNVGLWHDLYLSAFALKDLTGASGYGFGLSLTMPLGSRDTVGANWFQQDDTGGTQLQLQRSLPVGRGFGYQLGAGVGDGARDSAALFAQNDVGTYSAEAARFQGSSAYRLGARGGVAVLGGRGFLTRWLDDSFGVVKVGNYPNVQVYVENQPIAHTNSHGMALVPRLRSFQDNHISIEQADLPLDAQIDAVQLDARPAFRSGVLVDFPVRSIRGALLTIVLQDGSPLPAGAVVKRIGDAQEFPVAMRGEAYMTGLDDHNQLQAEWRDRTCAMKVDMPENDDPLPRLGPFVCDLDKAVPTP